jgi:hypothetical protein
MIVVRVPLDSAASFVEAGVPVPYKGLFAELFSIPDATVVVESVLGLLTISSSFLVIRSPLLSDLQAGSGVQPRISSRSEIALFGVRILAETVRYELVAADIVPHAGPENLCDHATWKD